MDETLQGRFGIDSAPPLPIWQFLAGLVATALLCHVLAWVYQRHGKALSNRSSFASNFVLLGVTTMLIISVVKSSLALSLGLVGALSIVRFRTAVKEPEELAYLFLTIAIGLGFGANQWLVTLSAFTAITAIIWLKSRLGQERDGSNLYLTVVASGPEALGLDDITDILRNKCEALDLKRFDRTDSTIEVSYAVSFEDVEAMIRAEEALLDRDPTLRVSFVDADTII